MSLLIHITAQGRAALVNADHTGTGPVTITSVGVTETWFDPSTDPPALPGQLKTLSTIAGTVVADDVIHVTLRDDSADAYDLRGFGLYLDDGTLFAVHAQPDVILAKTASSMLLLSADIQLADIDAASITFGDASFTNPPASETVSGVLRLATDAQAIAGTDRTRAVPPGALKAALDARLGPASPSSFIKGLLSLATAAALRAALSIKSAALKDEGAGGGLDADTVDGQHAAAFAFASHTHGWADITGTVPTWNQDTAGNAATATKLATARSINGTSFDGTANITTVKWGAARTLTIGNTGKSVDGSGNVSWTLSEIGAATSGHNHTLDSLSNVTVASNSQGEILQWNGTAWINRTLAEAGILSTTATAAAATKLATARTINGTSFNGTANITTANWGTARTLTIGAAGKSVNGSANVTWTLSDIGAASNDNPSIKGIVHLHGASTVGLRLNAGSAREVRFVANQTPNVGLYDQTNGQWLFVIGGTDNASFRGTVTASGFTVSSRRDLKQDIRALEVDSDIVDLFQPVTFRYKAAPEREVAGMIREDVAEIFPLAVTDDGIDYGQLVPLLIATIQRDRARLRELVARVEALESKGK